MQLAIDDHRRHQDRHLNAGAGLAGGAFLSASASAAVAASGKAQARDGGDERKRRIGMDPASQGPPKMRLPVQKWVQPARGNRDLPARRSSSATPCPASTRPISVTGTPARSRRRLHGLATVAVGRREGQLVIVARRRGADDGLGAVAPERAQRPPSAGCAAASIAMRTFETSRDMAEIGEQPVGDVERRRWQVRATRGPAQAAARGRR